MMFPLRIALAVLVGATVALAGDLFVTLDSGERIVLLQNKTWSYEKGVHEDLADDMALSLSDGRDVLIRTDYTWRVMSKAEAGDMAFKESLKTISETGRAESPTLKVAQQKAKSIAIDRLSQKIRSISRKAVNAKKLTQCIDEQEKDVESSEKFTNQWSATITMKLDKEAILGILDCASAAKKDTTAAKAGAKKDSTGAN